jgi:flagellar motor switch protein FliM
MDKAQPFLRPRRQKYVESYDFKHPKLFSKEIMRTLRALHETLARSLSRTFNSILRGKVDIQLTRINQLVMSEFIHQIPSPSSLYLLAIEELGGDLILEFQPGFCLYMIERQSGGRGSSLQERRNFTTIEEKIMARIMKRVNQQIIEAWEPYMMFTIRNTTYESKPENVHLINDDPAIVAEYVIEAGGDKVEMKIAYPYSLLKESMNEMVLRLGSHPRKEELSDEAMSAYQQTLKQIHVKMQPLLGTTNLSVWDLLHLEVGDAIPLTQKIDKPLMVRVNGVEKMTAFPGTVQNRRAVKIYEILNEIKESELI